MVTQDDGAALAAHTAIMDRETAEILERAIRLPEEAWREEIRRAKSALVALLVPQSDEGIDGHGAAGRQGAGDSGDSQNEAGQAEKCGRIVERNAV